MASCKRNVKPVKPVPPVVEYVLTLSEKEATALFNLLSPTPYGGDLQSAYDALRCFIGIDEVNG